MDEFARGWKPLVAAMCGMACGIMALTLYTQGVFVGPVTAELGWTREQFYRGFTIMMLAGLVTAPIAGALVDRLGPRQVGLTGLAGHALGYLILSLNPGPPGFWYLSFLLLALFAAGSLPIPWLRVVTSWFVRRRGLAIGLTMAASGIVAVIAPPIVERLIEAFGWRNAYRILGLGAFLMALPIVWRWLHPNPDADTSLQNTSTVGLTPSEALRTYRFWALAIGLSLSALAIVGALSQFFPLLEGLGYTRVDAAWLASVLGLHVILGRLVVGLLLDRYWAPAVAAVFLALPLPTFGMLILGLEGTAVSILAAMTIGLAAGAELDCIAFLTTRYFGTRHFGSIYGAQFALFTVASALSPLGYALAFDLTGAYTIVLVTATGLLTVAVVFLLTLGKTPEHAPA